MHTEIPAAVISNDICGIELPAQLGRDVSEFLRANRLPEPIEMVGGHRVLIASAPSRATKALDSLQRSGARVYGASKMSTVNVTEIPAVVVIAAAVRAVTSGRRPATQTRAVA